MNALVEYCKKTFDLTAKHYAEEYKSFSVCLLDAVYSLSAHYMTQIVPMINRYAEKYMNNNCHGAGDNLSDLIKHIESYPSTIDFAFDVLKNVQISGKVRKIDIVYKIAKRLALIGINSINDFRNFADYDLLYDVINTVKGMGQAGTNYLFMLAGDENRCKPDVHIHHCMRDAFGKDLKDEECQEEMRKAVALLKQEFPELTVRRLDGIIWNYYQSHK